MIYYIASPYTAVDAAKSEDNFRKVTEFVSILTKLGMVAISPITYGHTLLSYQKMPNTYEFWSNFCTTILAKCDVLVVLKLPEWELSNGVSEERSFAAAKGIPIIYIDPLDYVHEFDLSEEKLDEIEEFLADMSIY